MKKGTKLTQGERYFQQLPPKKEREEKQFNEWVDARFDVCGWDKRRLSCVS